MVCMTQMGLAGGQDDEPIVVQREIRTRLYASPCGGLLLGAVDGQLCLCDWEVAAGRERVRRRVARMLEAGYAAGTDEVLDHAARQLDEYFGGMRTEFDMPLRLVGTPFQEAVWRKLLSVSYGQTVSYSSLALALGRSGAVRAVATACGANALSLFVPCHRAVGLHGVLTGYAGGLAAKSCLLALESHGLRHR